MKIMNWPTFASMPAGTVFAKYAPCVFEAFCIKGDTIYSDAEPIDFFYFSVNDSIDSHDSGESGQLLQMAEEEGASVPLSFNIQSRDGCFEHDQLYAVWEKHDVEALIFRLNDALKQGFPSNGVAQKA